MIVVTQLPDGASKERTDAVLDKIQKTRPADPGRRACRDRQRHLDPRQSRQPRQRRRRLRRHEGMGRAAQGTGPGSGIDPAAHQRRPASRSPKRFSFAVLPPPIQGVGNVGGFTMQVEIRNGDFDYDLLQSLANTVVADGNAQSGLQRLATTFRAGAPQYSVVVDRTKAEALGITVGQVFSALSGYVGSNYVTQFNKFGHVFQVYTQADADKRATVDDIRNLKVRAGNGTMTPIGTAIEVSQVTGSAADQPLQSLSDRDRRRLRRRPASVRARRSTSWSRSALRRSRPERASTGPRCPTRRRRSATRPITSSASRSCSSISCWPASTRAGSCRSP